MAMAIATLPILGALAIFHWIIHPALKALGKMIFKSTS